MEEKHAILFFAIIMETNKANPIKWRSIISHIIRYLFVINRLVKY